jgi:cytochrome c oxidase subunit II
VPPSAFIPLIRPCTRTVIVLALAIVLGEVAPRAQAPQPVRTIVIHARKFAFLPNTITLKKDETVKLTLISDDVHHGLAVRGLGIRAQIIPGHPAEVVVTPTAAGDFPGSCMFYCGSGHRDMQFMVHVVE